MEVRYSIVLHPKVTTKDIPRLDAFWRREIRDAVRGKLKTGPELYGKPLRHTLKGCRTLRIEDYRVVFKISKKTVQILIIDHRSVVYKEVLKRLAYEF